MNKKSLGVISIALVLIGAGWGIRVMTSGPSENVAVQTDRVKARVVSVDEVVNDPEKFILTLVGIIGVEGTVTKIDESHAAFMLGCEDACIVMPVKFNGQPPKEGANVVAYGEVKKTEQDKYIFVAQEIQSK